MSLATQYTVADGFLSWSRSFSRLLPYAKYRKVWLFSMLSPGSVRKRMRTRQAEVWRIISLQKQATTTEVETWRVFRAELREHELQSDRNEVLAFQHSHTILMLIPCTATGPYSHSQYMVCLMC